MVYPYVMNADGASRGSKTGLVDIVFITMVFACGKTFRVVVLSRCFCQRSCCSSTSVDVSAPHVTHLCYGEGRGRGWGAGGS